MKLTELQRQIIDLLRNRGRLTEADMALELKVAKSDVVSDLALLKNLGIVNQKPGHGYYYQGSRNYIVFAEILKYYSVENIMSMPVIIDDRVTVYDAIVTLFLENVGSVYITRDDDLVGVVSRKDLLRAAIGSKDLDKTPVNVVMTRMPNIKVVTLDTSVFECAKIIVDSQIDGVPVVKKVGKKLKVVGRITKTNITNLFVRMGYDYNVEELIL